MKSIQGFILYFDIIGYKDYIQNRSEKEKEKFKNILDGFSKKADWIFLNPLVSGTYKPNKDRIITRCFSDNFLFVYQSRSYEECDTINKKRSYLNDLMKIKYVACNIQQMFLEQGIMTRGSISFGSIDYNDRIVYGKALINAIEIEEGGYNKNHPEPSIRLDDYFEQICINNNVEFNRENQLFFFHRNDSITYYIIIDGIRQYLRGLKLEGLDNNTQTRILFKIQWVIQQMNDYFDFNGKKELYLNQNNRLCFK